MFGIGGGGGQVRAAGFAEAEWQLPGELKAISLFGRGAVGGEGFRSLIGGARVQFGSGADLMTRHRQDLLLPYGGCGEEQFEGIGHALFYQNAG